MNTNSHDTGPPAPDVSKLPRKERESARHRAEILDAAEQVFSESGFVSARMEDIARRAEFAVGTLYRFFDSKEELYAALLREKSELLRRRASAELEGPADPVEKLKNVFHVRMDMYWEHRRFFHIFFHETAGTLCDPRAGFTPEIRERYQAFVKALEGLFEQGIAEGRFRGGDAAALTLAFEGMIRAYAIAASREDPPQRNRRREEALLDIFLRGALER